MVSLYGVTSAIAAISMICPVPSACKHTLTRLPWSGRSRNTYPDSRTDTQLPDKTKSSHRTKAPAVSLHSATSVIATERRDPQTRPTLKKFSLRLRSELRPWRTSYSISLYIRVSMTSELLSSPMMSSPATVKSRYTLKQTRTALLA